MNRICNYIIKEQLLLVQCIYKLSNITFTFQVQVGRFDRIYSFGVIQYFKEQQFLRICRMLRSSLLWTA